MAVGHALRDAREARGLTLEQIAGETHIPRHFLESIERDEFDQLPAPVYVRGFIRAYAGFLRVSAALLIDQLPDPWRQQSAPIAAIPAVRRLERPREPDSWLTDWDAMPAVHRGNLEDPPPPPPIIPAPETTTREPLAPAVAPAVRSPAPPLIDDLEDEDTSTEGVLAEAPRRRRGLAGLLIAPASVVAVGALAVAGLLALDGGSGSPATGVGGGPASPPSPTAASGADVTAAAAAEPASPTPDPSPEPSPTPLPSPTPTAELPPTAVAPPNAFAYCESLGGGNYTCGPSPWRVVCAPSGPFFDPAGTVPSPIPASWAGWSETTVTGRLEYIWQACG